MGSLQNNGSQLDEGSLRTLLIEVEPIVNNPSLTNEDLAGSDSLDMILSLSLTCHAR